MHRNYVVCVVSEGCDCEVVPIYARKVEGKLLLETQQQLATAEKFLVGCCEPSSDLGIGRADGKQLVNVDDRRNITSSRFHILPLKTKLFSAKVLGHLNLVGIPSRITGAVFTYVVLPVTMFETSKGDSSFSVGVCG